MGSRLPFGVGEWYHCFNRGVDKRLIFECRRDYERFLLQIYICNGVNTLRASELYTTDLESVLTEEHIDVGDPLVELGAYALMPNHFHFILKERSAGSIALFMQRLCTAYTMYFNGLRERSGSLFAGTYKAKHVDNDRYLKRVVSYVLMNPAELFEPRWKEGLGDINSLSKALYGYPYSSLPDFFGWRRPLNKVVSGSLLTYYDKTPTLFEILQEAKLYYEEVKVKPSDKV
jgi:putative transposase